MATNSKEGQPDFAKALSRFWAFVDKRGDDDCWNWQGGKNQQGYGLFWLNGRTIVATRAYYVMRGVALQVEQLVCHSCDNPSCVNPRHLWIGTHSQNMLDAYSKGRKSVAGENHPAARLTREKVKEIRVLAQSGYSQSEISVLYGVTKSNIQAIVARRSWKGV